MKNIYRIWNIDNGQCWSSTNEANSPYEAFNTARDRLSFPSGTYLVAKISTTSMGNHHEFGVFKYTAPVPGAVVTVNLQDLV